MVSRKAGLGRMAHHILVNICLDMVLSTHTSCSLDSIDEPSRFILPLLGEYIDSGYRTPKDRFIYSLRSNGRYQLIVFALAVAGLVYVFLQNGFEGTSVKALVMA